MKHGNAYGAIIERGEIMGMEDGGYIVKSLSRMGVITPPIQAQEPIEKINAGTDAGFEIEYRKYAAGDRVYFFMFDDGRGMVIAPIKERDA